MNALILLFGLMVNFDEKSPEQIFRESDYVVFFGDWVIRTQKR